jgi:hypothetical protein
MGVDMVSRGNGGSTLPKANTELARSRPQGGSGLGLEPESVTYVVGRVLLLNKTFRDDSV